MTTRIRNARIIDPANQRDETTDIWIAEGRIAAAEVEVEQTIDASGLWLLPGAVDLCARMHRPDQTSYQALASEVRAAAAGGYCHVLCPPEAPRHLDTAAAVRQLQTITDPSCRVHALGALSRALGGVELADMGALRAAACRAVSNGRAPMANSRVLRAALSYARTLDLTVFLAPEEADLAAGGCAHDGRVATRLGLTGIPAAAETVALARALALVADTGSRVHFERLSCASAVDMLDQAKQHGLPVTADVAIHQLLLSDVDVSTFDARFHTRPPLRDPHDRSVLLDGLRRGVIDAIVSDHRPLPADAKLAPFAQTEPGIAGIETALALGLRLVDDDQLSVTQWVQAMSAGPGAIIGYGGRLDPGQAADICLFDPEAVWRVKPGQGFSFGGNTPFTGWELRGRAVCTLLSGRIAYQRPDFAEERIN